MPKQTTLQVGKMTYIVKVMGKMVTIERKIGTGTLGTFEQGTYGRLGENLASAASGVGMTPSDLTAIAIQLDIALPRGVGVPVNVS